MTPPPAVSRAPAGGILRATGCQAPPQAARSALDAEHGRQADQRVKGPCGPALATHPSVPSPGGRTACRAQGSRVPVSNAITLEHGLSNLSKTPIPQSLLNPAIRFTGGTETQRHEGDNARLLHTFRVKGGLCLTSSRLRVSCEFECVF